MDDLKPGDLLLLTQAFDVYMHQKNPHINVIYTNRIAKLEDIIDWNSEKGKIIKDAREKSGKWKNLPLEDNKYIVSIFYHDLIGRQGQRGVAERGVSMFRLHPETKQPFFEKMPDWLFKTIAKKCESFSVEKKDVP